MIDMFLVYTDLDVWKKICQYPRLDIHENAEWSRLIWPTLYIRCVSSDW